MCLLPRVHFWRCRRRLESSPENDIHVQDCLLHECKYCRGLGSLWQPSDYVESVLTSRPERCAISRKSATGICRNIHQIMSGAWFIFRNMYTLCQEPGVHSEICTHYVRSLVHIPEYVYIMSGAWFIEQMSGRVLVV